MPVALTSGSCGRWRAGPFFEVAQAEKFHGFVLMKSQSAPAPHSRGVRTKNCVAAPLRSAPHEFLIRYANEDILRFNVEEK
jgi:hypothetical protein